MNFSLVYPNLAETYCSGNELTGDLRDLGVRRPCTNATTSNRSSVKLAAFLVFGAK